MTDRVLTQTEQIKALTHPLRIRLIDLLRSGRELTATEAAEETGESVASCSFHLRQLAKFGFVEPGERRGREKPWRAVAGSVILDPSPDDPESFAAAMAAGRAFLAQSVADLERWMERSAQDDPEWTDSSHQRHASFWATKEEYAEVAAEIGRLLDRFAGRDADPSLRPEGARHARLLAALWTELPDGSPR